MKFVGKCTERDDVILAEETQIQKGKHNMFSYLCVSFEYADMF